MNKETHIKVDGKKVPIVFNAYTIFKFLQRNNIPLSKADHLVQNFGLLFEITYEAAREAARQRGKKFKIEMHDFCISLGHYPKSVSFATKVLMEELQSFMDVYSKAQEEGADPK